VLSIPKIIAIYSKWSSIFIKLVSDTILMEISGKKVHDIRLILKKIEKNTKIVYITVRRTKKEKPLTRKSMLTEDVYDDNPNYWTSFRGQQISVYHRKDKYIYVNSQQHSIIPTEIGQRLESLVFKVFNDIKSN